MERLDSYKKDFRGFLHTFVESLQLRLISDRNETFYVQTYAGRHSFFVSYQIFKINSSNILACNVKIWRAIGMRLCNCCYDTEKYYSLCCVKSGKIHLKHIFT